MLKCVTITIGSFMNSKVTIVSFIMSLTFYVSLNSMFCGNTSMVQLYGACETATDNRMGSDARLHVVINFLNRQTKGQNTGFKNYLIIK